MRRGKQIEVKETDIALTLVAGRRPELLKRTLRSFGEKVFDNFRIAEVFANIDPFMGTAEDGEACKKIILARFPFAEISAPATPNFSEAVRSLWSKPRQPYFFHLEDDWLALEEVTPDRVFPLFEENTRMVSMLSLEHGVGNPHAAFRTTRKRIPFTPFKPKRPKFTMSPCFVERGFAQEYARLMDVDFDPERQNYWKHGRYNPKLSRFCNKFRNALLKGRTAPALVMDIGREYQAERGIVKTFKKGRVFWGKRAILLVLLLLPPARAGAADYAWPVVRVVDGDTVEVDASADLQEELARLKVRLRGVDTPEKGRRAKCPSERDAGRAATAFTRSAIAAARTVVIRDPSWGKWGGRVIADLLLDGRSLSAALIAAPGRMSSQIPGLRLV